MRDLNAPSLAVLTVVLAGCFSGSDTPETITSDPAPAKESRASIDGAVTGFGSVYVGGKRYATDADTVYAVEGEGEVRGRQDRVALGMKVRVIATGKAGERRAERIEIDTDLRGPVRSVTPNAENPAVGMLTVIGQDVMVDGLTVFGEDVADVDDNGQIDLRDLDPALFEGAVVVKISGYATEDGLLATRIDRLDDSDDDEVEVKGFVDAVATDGSNLTVNGAEFAVNGATALDDGLVVDETLVGRFVEVEAVLLTDGSFLATKIEDEDKDDAEEGDEFEIEGILQSLDLASTPNVAVIAGRTLEIVDASALEGLVGKRVDVEARVGADGVLTITEVKLEGGNFIEVRDEVVSIDQNAGVFTTRLGLVVGPTGEARVQDKVDRTGGDKLEVGDFLRRLRIGDVVRAKGRPGAEGVVWTKIERRAPKDGRCMLKGPVDTDSIFADRFSILGITVNTAGLGDDGFEVEGAEGRTAFYDALQVGSVVKAKSGLPADCQMNGLLLSAEGEVEIDGEDDVEGTEVEGDGSDGEAEEQKDLVGTVRTVDAVAATFDVLERTVTVTRSTLFDDDLLRAKGFSFEDDKAFGDLEVTLDQLLVSGDRVEVDLDADGNAVEIELAE